MTANLFSQEILKLFKQYFADELHNFYIVGGAVRDSLLAREIKDIDICSKLTPAENIKLCQEKNIRYIETGIEFGTITILLENQPVEITSLRQDIKTDGRKAQVTFGHNLPEDAARRDFTINALYLDFNGKIYDFYKGQDDLKNNILRFIGNPEQRIAEDHLRILRFYRFAAEIANLRQEQKSAAACCKLFTKIKQLSASRIRQEFYKLLNGANYAAILTQLHKDQLLSEIFTLNSKINISKITHIEHYFAKLLFFSEIEQEQKSLTANLDKYFSLTRSEKKLIALIYKEKENLANKWHIANLNYFLAFYPKEIVLFLADLAFAKDFMDLATLEFAKNYITNCKLPDFPLSAQDLFPLNIAQTEFSKILKQAKIIWADENFTSCKESLLRKICSKK